MKRILALLAVVLLLCGGCAVQESPATVAATTLPVYEFTLRLCEGTGITVTRLVTENVSCLHDYSLNVRQVKAAEAAQVIVISGMGLEDFMADILADKPTIDSSTGIEMLECTHEHDHVHEPEHSHHHEADAHIWLSPENAMVMAKNICEGLCREFPQHQETFRKNLEGLLADMEVLRAYGEAQLQDLSCRDMVTFHDGFSYFADCYDLHILEAVEEESGSEASAKELIHLIGIVEERNLPAIFIETNGSTSAAQVIARETGAQVYTLDMAMSGDSWFAAMYYNIDTIKEAMG